ncbi:MAG: hypothetical protein H6649_01100 [Caldilineae bacterium]|nr:hypothetical protein [Anaerolineae bacterium]MCB0199499.1 hypothetical protein [Anaerolineae bacterium]MCB0204933.1 hypothetical protein [Anaerolineae bacterium]MCB0255810.1 hypothetical protein [Anaerolineae bacterium]MCB9152638.1 hypothetical protein [Caldilineae bacterium]
MIYSYEDPGYRTLKAFSGRRKAVATEMNGDVETALVKWGDYRQHLVFCQKPKKQPDLQLLTRHSVG